MLIDDGRTSRMAGVAGTGVGVAFGVGFGVGLGVGVGDGVGEGVGVGVTAAVGVGAGVDLVAVIAAEPQEASKTLMMAIQRTARIVLFCDPIWVR
jgi:hypothetical protein